jgi:1-acyl-sn-glycerol-3-phosphate acyltransferase
VTESKSQYSVPFRVSLARALLRPFFRGLFYLLSRLKVTGFENVPSQGAYLIAMNHVSLFDVPLVLAFWPTAPEAVGASDVWDRPGQSTLVRLYGAVPVHRGKYDRRLLDTMLFVLRSGKPLLIAPEGGRSHDPGMRRALPGVAYVVDKAKVPVVPIGIVGATDDFLRRALRGTRPRIEMRVGSPVHLPAVDGRGEARRTSLQKNADLIMEHIAELLPNEYGGYYGSRGTWRSETAQ